MYSCEGDLLVKGAKGSTLSNAQAYRYRVLMFLHRTVLERLYRDEIVQGHVHTLLLYCNVVVASGGPVSALLWPLFVAACEAQTAVDRGLARRVFLAIKSRQGMANIEKARAVVMEVWRRADSGACDAPTSCDSVDLWRTIAGETGLNLVLG